MVPDCNIVVIRRVGSCVSDTDERRIVNTVTFDEFVRGRAAALDRYACALTGNRHSANDLVQETLIKVLGAWRRIAADDPMKYATTVMFRTHVSRWRRNRRHDSVELTAEPYVIGDPYAPVIARLTLDRMLADLPRLQRAVLVASYLGDYADDEIADMIGRRPATVRSLRHRALTTLREAVDAPPPRITNTNSERVSMEPLEMLLREKFSVPVAGTPADIDDLIQSTRRRRRSRTMATVATGIAAVVAASLALALTLHGGVGDGSDPAGRQSTSPASLRQLENAIGRSVFWFTDSSHGYGTIIRCHAGVRACTTTYESTTDGGATFTPVTVPTAIENGTGGLLYTFSNTQVAIGIPTAKKASWWISSDSGRTWSQTVAVVAGATDQVPTGAIVGSQGAGSPTVVVSPDGTRNKLATAPLYSDPEPRDFMIGGIVAGPIFANMENGHLRVSTDRGATWHSSKLAVKAEQVRILGTDGPRTFAVTTSEHSLDHLLVSSDEGRTFTKIATPMVRPVSKEATTSGGESGWTDTNSFAMAGGSVIVTNGSGRLWRLAPGATSFHTVKTPEPVVEVAGGGAVATVQMGTKHRLDFEFTADGTHFTASPLHATD